VTSSKEEQRLIATANKVQMLYYHVDLKEIVFAYAHNRTLTCLSVFAAYSQTAVQQE